MIEFIIGTLGWVVFMYGLAWWEVEGAPKMREAKRYNSLSPEKKKERDEFKQWVAERVGKNKYTPSNLVESSKGKIKTIKSKHNKTKIKPLNN